MDTIGITDQQQAIEKYRSFVIGQLRAGADSNSVAQRIIQMGVDPALAGQIVQTIQAEVGVMPGTTSGQALVSTAIPMALLGGIVAAAVGGVVWGLIVKVTDFEIGYMAVGVGLLCGLGVVLCTGGRRGPSSQACAIITSVLGIVIGKYATAYFELQSYIADKHPELIGKISFFSSAFIRMGTRVIIDTFHPLDVLWIILAVMAANRITRMR